jgi:hypothetical protein
MTNYTVATNFGAKDALISGNPLKGLKGAELTVEFNNIATAVGTKQDSTYTPPGSGAVATTVAAKLAQEINAKDFGAVGNGVTLDSTAIANAFAANATGPIFLTGGPYNFTLGISGTNKGLLSYTEGASQDIWYWGRDYSGTKTAGVGAANLGTGPAGFMFDLRNDTAAANAGFFGNDFVRALYGRTVFGSSLAGGGRIGVLGEAIHSLGATNIGSGNRNYVGVVGNSHSFTGDGGVPGTNRGAYFGGNFNGYGDAAATNLLEVTGGEADTFTQTGASMAYLLGWSIVGNNSVHGTNCDAALSIGGSTSGVYGPHVGWNFGVCFTNLNGNDATYSGTTLIGAYFNTVGLRTITAGLDTSKFTCTSGIVLGPNLVLGDNTLNLGASGANVSTVQAGNNVAAANLDLMPKGGGAARVYDGIAGTVRMFIENVNGIRLVPVASGAPQNNGELMIQATSNTSLTFKFKGSDGTIRTNSLTLA